ncbi:Asp-tRNA(Asn)/Glu-tRNA(Gln) amidotransferase subunit GatC [Candidatus Parcubacteria bacterium]|nr:Asp-tRNA(Asn)/Glu-tRNA(Gln) amidotransferase subunit GatC [Candidatus Parcubacteria bacterium]
MDKAEVQRLAKLARIEILDEEAERLSHEFGAILKYVEDVKEVKKLRSGEKPEERNIMRNDSSPHERGLYTEKILSNAPSREGQYIKVKKIL